jgi:hypothetical protein
MWAVSGFHYGVMHPVMFVHFVIICKYVFFENVHDLLYIHLVSSCTHTLENLSLLFTEHEIIH